MTLSDLRLLEKHRSIETISLGGGEGGESGGSEESVDWYNLFIKKDKTYLNKLDRLATKHVQDFLEAYQLEMNYEIKHKLDNVSKKIFYFKKAHYVMDTVFNGVKYKVRGTNEKHLPTYLGNKNQKR